ncbi:MAG: hypothetical protein WCT01_00790 [Candidatus Shapirobacteria bacterium]|jgi:GTP-binding protein EngB required for normal cell division
MRVDEAKKLIGDLSFATEVNEKANEILFGLADDYVLDDERIDKLTALIDLEIEMAQIEADACEQTSQAMGDFLKEVDTASEKAAVEIDQLTENVINQGKQKLQQTIGEETVVK